MKAMLKRWSFAEQRRLMEVSKSSKSFEEIVKRTGRKPDSVRKMALKLGITIDAQSGKYVSMRGLKAKGK
ncbi:hypothetical protein [Bradyrhizobium ottawaense]|uniref:hypothetical protein n=2 Tax=Bradyrhizobium TaxID=374 RepID=UPI003D9B5F11